METVVAAIVGGVFGLASGILTARAAAQRERARIDSELDLTRENLQGQLDADMHLLEHRLHTELRTEFQAEAAIRQLLTHDAWKTRTFDTIRRHVGGWDDEGLRRLLVRTGALRFYRKEDGAELWGLRERNEDQLPMRDDAP